MKKKAIYTISPISLGASSMVFSWHSGKWSPKEKQGGLRTPYSIYALTLKGELKYYNQVINASGDEECQKNCKITVMLEILEIFSYSFKMYCSKINNTI